MVQSDSPYHRWSIQTRKGPSYSLTIHPSRLRTPAVGSIPRSLLCLHQSSQPHPGSPPRQSALGYVAPMFFGIQKLSQVHEALQQLVRIRGDVTDRRVLPEPRSIGCVGSHFFYPRSGGLAPATSRGVVSAFEGFIPLYAPL